MLRKFAYNKIFRTTGMLLLLLLLLVFPASKKYSLKDEKTIHTSGKIAKSEAFLLDKDNYVARCHINILNTNDEAYVKKLVELLIIDGKYENYIPNGFKAIFPSDTKINNIKLKDDTIYLDISSDILELNSEMLLKALDALTYNLTTISNVKYIYVNVDNKALNDVLKGKINVNMPLKRENGINSMYDIKTYENTTKTTVYFLNKNSSGYYYVPVTKVNNDNSDKIKIIVDELTSSHIYETNLMSFLNYNTKLIDYKLEDDKLTLNFNNYIFDDAKEKSVLEEVVYSICLSVRDNYNVKEVVFNADGKEILKSVIKDIE